MTRSTALEMSRTYTAWQTDLRYLANAVFGNTISGIVDFFDVAKTATNAAPVYASLVTNGVRLGLPGGGIVSQGLAGTTQDTILKKAFSNLGPSGSVKAAGLAGYLKLGYDVMTFGYGLYECTNF